MSKENNMLREERDPQYHRGYQAGYKAGRNAADYRPRGPSGYDERAHTAALRLHDDRYADMTLMRDLHGRASSEYRQAREVVVSAAAEVRRLGPRRRVYG